MGLLKEGMTLHFKTVITVIVIESAVSYLFFLYQARLEVGYYM